MLGKIIGALLLMVAGGIVLGLTDVIALEALGAILLLAGGAALGLLVLLALALAIEGLLFGAKDRWHRFN